MGSDLSMNPPTEVKRAIVDKDGFLVLQSKWDYEEESQWKQVWRGPNNDASQKLITAATGITDFGPVPIRTLRQRLHQVGIDDLTQQQQVVEQVAHWLEDHANDELRKRTASGHQAASILGFHAKEALT